MYPLKRQTNEHHIVKDAEYNYIASYNDENLLARLIQQYRQDRIARRKAGQP